MKKYTKLLVALALVVGILLPSIQAAAQSSSLSVVPRVEMNVQKGTTQSGKLTVGNPDQKNPLDLTLRVIDFTAKDQTGTPNLDISEDPKPEPWSVKEFLKLPEEVTIAPGASKDIEFSVTIPSGLGAGSYYSAVQYLAGSNGQKNVNLAASAVTYIFVNVPGDAKEQMTLTQLGAFSGEKGSTSGEFNLFYFGTKPKLISYTLKNEGNVAEKPVGAITLKNSFTGKTYRIDSINPDGSLALRGQERRFDSCIKTTNKTIKTATGEARTQVCDTPDLTPGRYTVTLSAFYGQLNGKSLEVMGTSSFWYLPWWFVVLVVLVVLALVTLVWWIVNKIRNHMPSSRKR